MTKECKQELVGKCGRCGVVVIDAEAEVCWVCLGCLCYACWDKYGRCSDSRDTCQIAQDME